MRLKEFDNGVDESKIYLNNFCGVQPLKRVRHTDPSDPNKFIGGTLVENDGEENHMENVIVLRGLHRTVNTRAQIDTKGKFIGYVGPDQAAARQVESILNQGVPDDSTFKIS